jgi:hypothetical protein
MMARIKIKDLPKDQMLTKEEIKKVTGGSLDGHVLDLQPTKISISTPTAPSLLDTRAARIQGISRPIERLVLPNMMHDAGP